MILYLLFFCFIKVRQLCCVYDGLCPCEELNFKDLDNEEQTQKQTGRNELMEACYIQSCYCSLGAVLLEKSRQQFDEFFKKLIGMMMIEDTQEKPATVRECTLVPGQKKTIDNEKCKTKINIFFVQDTYQLPCPLFSITFSIRKRESGYLGSD